MTKEKKTFQMGRMTNIELQIIDENYQTKSYLDIAKMLNRDPYSVKNIIEKKGLKTSLSGNPVEVDQDLQKKEFWPVLQGQFSPSELKIFSYHWNNICKQFKDDSILATEELQIIDLIKIEIMMDRNLIQQKENNDAIKRVQFSLESADEKDKEKITEFERQLSIYTSGGPALSREYRELQDKKNKLFSDLKATRSDRIKKIDASRESFISFLQKMISDTNLRKEAGLYLEKFRLAMLVEEQRLMRYHKYEDGRIDQCIFNEVSAEINNDTEDESDSE